MWVDASANRVATACTSAPLCTRRLTERRTLRRRRHLDVTKGRTLHPPPHGKAQSACERSPRVRFSVRVRAQSALFRRLRFSSPAQTWSHLTQRRILRRRPHVKAHSAPGNSRKSAFCTRCLTEKHTLYRRCHLDVTERRILGGRRHGKAHFARGPHQKAHSVCDRSRRMHFAVRVRVQSALFREGPRAECAFP